MTESVAVTDYRAWMSQHPQAALTLWRAVFESAICDEHGGRNADALRSALLALELAELTLMTPRPVDGDCALTRLLHSSLLLIRTLRAQGEHQCIPRALGRSLAALSGYEAAGGSRQAVLQACTRLIGAAEDSTPVMPCPDGYRDSDRVVH